MITALYAALGALLIVWLSLRVIKLRHREHVSLGDGDREELKIAIAAQANAVEYLPIALLLLFALEYNGAPVPLLHLFGIALCTGRLLHARAMISKDLDNRVRSMQITIWTLIWMAVANLGWLPWARLVTW